MIREAEIYVAADEAATGVYARMRADQWELLLPPVFDMPGADQPTAPAPGSEPLRVRQLLGAGHAGRPHDGRCGPRLLRRRPAR